MGETSEERWEYRLILVQRERQPDTSPYSWPIKAWVQDSSGVCVDEPYDLNVGIMPTLSRLGDDGWEMIQFEERSLAFTTMVINNSPIDMAMWAVQTYWLKRRKCT